MVTIMHAELCSAALAEASSEQAARLLGAADAERERTGLQLAPAEKERLDSDVVLGKQRIGGQWSHHYALGRAMTLEDALNETAHNPLARS